MGCGCSGVSILKLCCISTGLIMFTAMGRSSRATPWVQLNSGTLEHVPSCKVSKHTVQMSFA